MARILLLTPQLPVPPQALTGASQGTTIRNYSLLAGLAQRHAVDLASFADPEDLPGSSIGVSTLALLRPYCRRIETAMKPARSVPRRALDTLTTPLPDMALRLASPEMTDKIANLLASEDYDIVQVEGIEMAPYLGLALRPAPRRPFVLFDDHNAEYVLQQRNYLTDVRRPRRWLAAAYSLVQWQKLRAYERSVCRAADRVVAVSDVDREALLRLAPDLQITVVPNGVDLDFYRPGVVAPLPEMGVNALVFTGKMDYRPNVDAVLWFVDEVLPRIRSAQPDARFYVVGQRPHTRLGVLSGREDVVVTGRVPDVRPYIAGAAVFVVPLRIGGGTRLKVLEALALGQAVVSTRVGCDGFPFQDGREVRFADEPAPFADAVVALLRDHSAAARLGVTARAYVEAHFGWDAIIPCLEALYP